jgi:hypothetical protein
MQRHPQIVYTESFQELVVVILSIIVVSER